MIVKSLKFQILIIQSFFTLPCHIHLIGNGPVKKLTAKGNKMKLIKTAIAASILALSSTSAFAGTGDTSANTAETVRQVPVVKAPVLLKTQSYTSRKIKRIEIQPVETLVARDASTSDHSPFVFKTAKHKNTKTKTFRPSVSNAKSMPNLFIKK